LRPPFAARSFDRGLGTDAAALGFRPVSLLLALDVQPHAVYFADNRIAGSADRSANLCVRKPIFEHLFHGFNLAFEPNILHLHPLLFFGHATK
jgi:hypothetical protein